MRTNFHHKTFAFVALFIWLLTSWSGAHGHLCFDGQEPPVSIHMDMLGEHIEHDQSEQHNDADVNLNPLALAKFLKINIPLLIVAAFFFSALFKTRTIFVVYYSHFYSPRLTGLRPPLRAPPFFPA